MKRLLFFIILSVMMCPIWAQGEENLFEWQSGSIIAKERFLKCYKEMYTDYPTHVYKEYKISMGIHDYIVKIKGFEETMDLGGYDGFELYHEDKKILDYLSYEFLYDVRYITVDKCRDNFIKVPLSEDSFALFFGGWLFGSGGETPEMVVAVVSGNTAKVVFDDYAFAYKYTPGENFAMEYVDDINGYVDNSSQFTESLLKTLTKYKIWKEGNMLKYKSWK